MNIENQDILNTDIPIYISEMERNILIKALANLPGTVEELSDFLFENEDRNEFMDTIMGSTALVCRNNLIIRLSQANHETDDQLDIKVVAPKMVYEDDDE